jgi:hypothetical protein
VVGCRRAGHLGQPERLLVLDRVQPQRPGHRLERAGAGPDRAPLLQLGVPGHAHSGQLRDLLAPGQPSACPGGSR